MELGIYSFAEMTPEPAAGSTVGAARHDRENKNQFLTERTAS